MADSVHTGNRCRLIWELPAERAEIRVEMPKGHQRLRPDSFPCSGSEKLKVRQCIFYLLRRNSGGGV